MGVSKLPHKTCPFSLQVSVYRLLDRSLDRSVHPTMENRSDFIPTPEFLSQKSEFRSREIFQLGTPKKQKHLKKKEEKPQL